jgi:Photoprotection regulator fluorescence recovery protein
LLQELHVNPAIRADLEEEWTALSAGQISRATIREAKQKAERIKEPDEQWELERHLTQRSQEIDAKYEFKYSVLLLVLSDLVREGRIKLDDLKGPSEDKLGIACEHTQSTA